MITILANIKHKNYFENRQKWRWHINFYWNPRTAGNFPFFSIPQFFTGSFVVHVGNHLRYCTVHMILSFKLFTQHEFFSGSL